MGEEEDDGNSGGAQGRRGGVLYDGAERADLDVEREDGEESGNGKEHDGVAEQHSDVTRQAAREPGADGKDASAARARAEPVGEVATQEHASETTDDEQRAGEEIGLRGAEMEGAVARAEIDGYEGGGGRNGDVRQRLEHDAQPDGRDAYYSDDVRNVIGGRDGPCPYGRRGHTRGGLWRIGMRKGSRGVGGRIGDTPHDESQRETGDARDKKGDAPAQRLAEEVKEESGKDEGKHGTENLACTPAAHGTGACLEWIVVAEERGASGKIAGLADADGGAGENEAAEAAHEGGGGAHEAPETDASGDYASTREMVRQQAGREGGECIDDEKRAGEHADGGIGQMELGLERGADRNGKETVEIVQGVDAKEQHQHDGGGGETRTPRWGQEWLRIRFTRHMLHPRCSSLPLQRAHWAHCIVRAALATPALHA